MSYSNDKVYTRLKNIMLSCLALIIVFVLYNVIPFYYYYFEIKNQMFKLSNLTNEKTDIEIKEKLYAQIKYLKIPARKDDIIITRTRNEIKISLEYNEVFYITIGKKDYDLYIFNFLAEVKNKI
ncbi:MAG: hypothetical protein ACOX3T_07730 [Bdellovibrionota bacterium]